MVCTSRFARCRLFLTYVNVSGFRALWDVFCFLTVEVELAEERTSSMPREGRLSIVTCDLSGDSGTKACWNTQICDPGRHLQECPGARAGKCPTECFLSVSGHSEPGAQKHSKSTPWGTFRFGPLGTPVNGGRDRKHRWVSSSSHNVWGWWLLSRHSTFAFGPDTTKDSSLVALPMFRVVETVVLENGAFVSCRKQMVLAKIGETFLIARSTHKNKGLCSSDPGNRQKLRKWRMSPRQNDRLSKHRFGPEMFVAVR